MDVFDLNLIFYFVVFDDVCNVSCVGDLFGVSQLCVSIVFGWLCEYFGDLLFVCMLCGMELMLCVFVLLLVVCDVFVQIECGFVVLYDFDLVVSMYMFLIVLLDVGEIVFLLKLLQVFVMYVLYVNLCLVLFVYDEVGCGFEVGLIDFVVGYFFDFDGNNFFQ